MSNDHSYIPKWIRLTTISKKESLDYVLGDNTAFNISAMLLNEKKSQINVFTIWDFCCFVNRILLYDKILIAPDIKFSYGNLTEILKNRIYQFLPADKDFEIIVNQTLKDVKNKELLSTFTSIFNSPDYRKILEEYRRHDIEIKAEKSLSHENFNLISPKNFMLNSTLTLIFSFKL